MLNFPPFRPYPDARLSRFYHSFETDDEGAMRLRLESPDGETKDQEHDWKRI